MLADHFLAVTIQPLRAFFINLLAPTSAALGIGEDPDVDGHVPEHVQIVNIAEKILQFFQIAAPGGVFAWQKILHCVPETLDPDAEFVPCDLRAGAQGPLVEVVGCSPLLKDEVFEYHASGTDAGRAAGQAPAPLAPLFAIELSENV